MKNPIKVLIVEDSGVVRDFLVYIISSEPDMHVVGTAKNGAEAVKLAAIKKPDVITMDIEMPVMNGMEATRTIMSTKPVPIVIVTSSYHPGDVQKSFNAIEAGALAILEKPSGFNSPTYEKTRRELISVVRNMAEVKVVTRLRKYARKSIPDEPLPKEVAVDEKNTDYRIIALGVSTGGPQVLQQMIPLFPKDFKMPIVVVQHIPEGFLEGMVDWLSQTSNLELRVAQQGETLEPGIIYFCPPEFQISVNKRMEVDLKDEVPGYSVKPSVSYLFRSIGKNFGKEAVGVLMTGMGKDGAEELLMMKEKGALTIVQDEKSCVVFGMPGEAVKLGAQRYVFNPADIVNKLIELNNYK